MVAAGDWSVPRAFGFVGPTVPTQTPAPFIGPQLSGAGSPHGTAPGGGQAGPAEGAPFGHVDHRTDHHLPVPHLHEAVAGVRRRAQLLLDEWDLPAECLEDALMVISELITNAVLHALPPAVLRLCSSETDGCRTLRIEVTDGGPAPRAEQVGEGIEPDEHGRGIGIVSALSSCHGTRVGCSGVTRWAELPVAV
ncbi:ATP-binding protein [Streptomyces sp. NA02950]|uniref:ATP-binding protein n=1 Tax=Streptomyces sp. NA02950 TaxID=2742137 RepID=UPI0020CB20B1|nr:ATP-binding protein [Streptomyces sp. NA02950]